MADFYEQLKKICQEHNTTVYAVEKATGASKGSFIKWRTSSPSVDKIIEIADYFGVPMDYLIGRDILFKDQGYLEISKIYENAPSDEAREILKSKFIEAAKALGIDTVSLIGY